MSPERKGPSPLTLSLSPSGRGDPIRPSDGPVIEGEHHARAAALDAEIGQLAPEAVLREAIARFPREIALVSSFGAESAVLLHMAAAIDRHLPVVFVDTLRLFPETLAYRDTLVARLGLADVRTVGPQRAVMEQADPWHALFNVDPDRCCHLRKVEP
ncbi:MAG: phosphoadenosine phosphosulfate reductase family protein, partial [Chelatococcus sp.]|nr:phosphoadenosine phosphosulfate reductase family protein [Chelatococcus sp.]